MKEGLFMNITNKRSFSLLILFLSISLLLLHSPLVFAQLNSSETDLPTKEGNGLVIMHQSGFNGFSDGFQQNEISFNYQTNRFFFRYGINLINPGTHNFTENTLIGVTSSGDEVLLNNGSIQGGSLVFDVVHDTHISNYSQFEYFRIDVSYHDTLWYQQRSAVMIFRLNLPTKISGTIFINGDTYKWMESSWGYNRGLTINPGRMDYQLSPNPHNDPWYNKNQIKFYNEVANQLQTQGNNAKWVKGNWPRIINVKVNNIDYTMNVR